MCRLCAQLASSERVYSTFGRASQAPVSSGNTVSEFYTLRANHEVARSRAMPLLSAQQRQCVRHRLRAQKHAH